MYFNGFIENVADVNGNGRIDTNDAILIQGWISGQRIEQLYPDWGVNGSQPPPPTTYTITFNQNYTNAPANTTSTTGTNGRLANLPTPTRSGHRFVGWFNTSAATGGTQLSASTVHTANTTYWARWTLNPVTVTFNWNFPNAPQPVIIEANAQGRIVFPTYNPDVNPRKPGYTFDFWSGGRNYDIVVTSVGIINQNVTLYAQWKPIYQPLTVLHRYDEGFLRRFSSARSMITRYQNDVSEILVNVFDLIVNTDSIAPYTSISDTCKKKISPLTTARLSRLCDCDDDDKECILNYRVMFDLDAQFPIVNTAATNFCTINKARVSWSGHLLLDYKEELARATWWSNYGAVVMTSYDATMDGSVTFLDTVAIADRNLRFTYILLHELAHQIDANDHYCYKDGDPCSNKYCYSCRDRDVPNCVMNWQSRVITDRLRDRDLWNDLFCEDDCEIRIGQFLELQFKH